MWESKRERDDERREDTPREGKEKRKKHLQSHLENCKHSMYKMLIHRRNLAKNRQLFFQISPFEPNFFLYSIYIRLIWRKNAVFTRHFYFQIAEKMNIQFRIEAEKIKYSISNRRTWKYEHFIWEHNRRYVVNIVLSNESFCSTRNPDGKYENCTAFSFTNKHEFRWIFAAILTQSISG